MEAVNDMVAVEQPRADCGHVAALTCPECGGVLSEVKGQRPLRFRCQIGHAHTAQELAAKDEALDDAIRLALRVMEERVELVERMARDARDAGRKAVAELEWALDREHSCQRQAG